MIRMSFIDEKKHRVCYISNLGINDSNMYSYVSRTCSECVANSVDTLIVCGGISNDFSVSLNFVDLMGTELHRHKIRFRFMYGNTDLYSKETYDVDITKDFMYKASMFNDSQYYLFNNPIMYSNTWIIGIPSWYDYSLYRGKPISLSKLVNKRKFIFRNKDAEYLTDPKALYNSIEDTFDYSYNRECLDSFDNFMGNLFRKYKKPMYLTGVMYFYPTRYILPDKIMGNYFGSFLGSSKYFPLLLKYGFRECITGLPFNDNIVRVSGINFYHGGKFPGTIREYTV